MNQIQNSIIKEQMRQRNEDEARNYEGRRNQELNAQIATLRLKNNYQATPFLIAGVVLGIIFVSIGLGFSGFVVGVIIGAIACPLVNKFVVGAYNEDLEKTKQNYIRSAQSDVNNAYQKANEKTMREIDRYDNDVKAYCQKVLKNADSISSMVNHVTDMFQRMISHADAGCYMRFVEVDFVYVVRKTGINFHYQSNYTNPQDDYSFNKARYRDLNADTECEGLAQALAKLVIVKMKGMYPPNSLNISVSHMDAVVTLHFKAANKNFVAARDIV